MRDTETKRRKEQQKQKVKKRYNVDGGINSRGTLIPFQQIQTFELDTVDVPLGVDLINFRSHLTFLPL